MAEHIQSIQGKDVRRDMKVFNPIAPQPWMQWAKVLTVDTIGGTVQLTIGSDRCRAFMYLDTEEFVCVQK